MVWELFFAFLFQFIGLSSLVFLSWVIVAFFSAAKKDPRQVTKPTLENAQQSVEAERIPNERLQEANRQAELKSQQEAIRRLKSITQRNALNFDFFEIFRREEA